MLNATSNATFLNQALTPLAQQESRKVAGRAIQEEEAPQTSDARDTRLQNIKSRIKDGSYEIDFSALAQKLAQNLL